MSTIIIIVPNINNPNILPDFRKITPSSPSPSPRPALSLSFPRRLDVILANLRQSGLKYTQRLAILYNKRKPENLIAIVALWIRFPFLNSIP